MTQRIYKYALEIEREQTIEIYEYADLLTLQVQNFEIPTLWAIVDTSQKEITVTIHMFGTGWIIDLPAFNGYHYKHIGTVQIDGLVWHYFLEKNYS